MKKIFAMTGVSAALVLGLTACSDEASEQDQLKANIQEKVVEVNKLQQEVQDKIAELSDNVGETLQDGEVISEEEIKAFEKEAEEAAKLIEAEDRKFVGSRADELELIANEMLNKSEELKANAKELFEAAQVLREEAEQ